MTLSALVSTLEGCSTKTLPGRPDEIVPDLDQARAKVGEMFVDGIGIAGGSEFFLQPFPKAAQILFGGVALSRPHRRGAPTRCSRTDRSSPTTR